MRIVSALLRELVAVALASCILVALLLAMGYEWPFFGFLVMR